MKTLSQYLIESVDPNIVKKVTDMQLKDRKLELVNIKKALGGVTDLNLKAESIYNSISKYNSTADIKKALDDGSVEQWKNLNDAITKGNNNNPADLTVVLDVIGKVAAGAKLDAAIAEVAKKIM
jgi:hypothetical protein